MRLITIMLALLLASSGAWAEWVRVTGDDEIVLYIDPATIRKEGNLRRFWQVQDLNQRQKGGELSRRLRNEYDCKGERYRILSISSHSGPMATGETLVSGRDPSQWIDIPPGTMVEVILKIVCAR